MDSRIEELACIIAERCKESADNIERAADGVRGDRYWFYRNVQGHARSILAEVNGYRESHPEEYRDDEAAKLRGWVETFKAELISARQELTHYKEREKVQGWAPL